MRSFYCTFIILVLSGLCFSQQVVKTADGQKVILNTDHTWTFADDSTQTGSAGTGSRPDAETAQSGSIQSLKETDGPAGPAALSIDALPGQYRSMMMVIGGVAVVLLIIISILLVYFLILQPRKKRKPLLEATAVLALDIPKDQIRQVYEKAEALLEQAVANGLKKNDLSEANFALAYVRTRLEKYESAYITLENAGLDTRENAYLGLYLLIKLDKTKEAFDLYERHQKALEDAFDSRELASMAALKLGKKHWRNHEIEVAIRYFDFVRKLEIYTAKLPSALSNYRLTLGIAALFNSHLEEAGEHFEKAVQQAGEENRSDIEARIGLLLCVWREEKFPKIDDELGVIVEQMKTQLNSNRESGEEGSVQLEADAEIQIEKKKSLSEDDTLLRNVRFWYCVSRLYQWFYFKEKSGLPEEERKLLHERLQAVLDIDPEMGDPLFIRGLIDYFFAYDTDRKKAVEDIEQSDIHVPESDILVTKEKRLLEYEQKSLDRYLALLKKYLEDSTVPYLLRKELKEYLDRFSRFQSMADEFAFEEKGDETSASLQEIQARGELLRKRIDTIVKPKMKDDSKQETREDFEKLLKRLDKTSTFMARANHRLEETEQKLMINTGEFLFSEEETAEETGLPEKKEETVKKGE